MQNNKGNNMAEDENSVFDTLKKRIASSKDAELKEVYDKIRSTAGDDIAKIDDYIDSRIEKLGEQLREEYKESMELHRQEMKKSTVQFFILTVLTWLFIIGNFIIRFFM
jgi:hypothetical protein